VWNLHIFLEGIDYRQSRSDLEDKLTRNAFLEDILMSEGIVTHYMPIRIKSERRHETGIDVWFALEALRRQLSIINWDILVLITGDADFIPLIKKAHSARCKGNVLG
jgi:uncharacterized LabA/DUF88 family protein